MGQLRHRREAGGAFQHGCWGRRKSRRRPVDDAWRHDGLQGQDPHELAAHGGMEIHHRLFPFRAAVAPGQAGKTRESPHLVPVELGRAVKAMHTGNGTELDDEVVVADVVQTGIQAGECRGRLAEPALAGDQYPFAIPADGRAVQELEAPRLHPPVEEVAQGRSLRPIRQDARGLGPINAGRGQDVHQDHRRLGLEEPALEPAARHAPDVAPAREVLPGADGRHHGDARRFAVPDVEYGIGTGSGRDLEMGQCRHEAFDQTLAGKADVQRGSRHLEPAFDDACLRLRRQGAVQRRLEEGPLFVLRHQGDIGQLPGFEPPEALLGNRLHQGTTCAIDRDRCPAGLIARAAGASPRPSRFTALCRCAWVRASRPLPPHRGSGPAAIDRACRCRH